MLTVRSEVWLAEEFGGNEDWSGYGDEEWENEDGMSKDGTRLRG